MFKVTWPNTEEKLTKRVLLAEAEKLITKRMLLSEASKLFDPLGWLAPVVVNAKLIMQEVWVSGIGWDDEVPQQIKSKWLELRDELPQLKFQDGLNGNQKMK